MSIRVVIHAEDKAVRTAFERLAKLGRSPRRVLQRMGLWLRRDAQRRLRARSPKRFPARGRLSKSMTMQAVNDRLVVVGSALRYAAIQQLGGVITPRTVKCLTIPLLPHLARYGIWPRDLPKNSMRFVPAKKPGGNVVGVLVRAAAADAAEGAKKRDGTRGKPKRGKVGEAMYLLVRSSLLKGERYLVPDSAAFRAFAIGELTREAEQAARRR